MDGLLWNLEVMRITHCIICCFVIVTIQTNYIVSNLHEL